MSEEQLKAFLEAVKTDAELQEKLKEATDTGAIAAIAKAAGFVISVEELKRSQAEISEEELEGVAGGGINIPGLQAALQNFENYVKREKPVHTLNISCLHEYQG